MSAPSNAACFECERDLAHLRSRLDLLKWLVKNAEPEAWAKGAEAAKLFPFTRAPDGGLPYYVLKAMPKRAPTYPEMLEICRLVDLCFDPADRAIWIARAMENPPWSIWEYTNHAIELGFGRI